MTTAHTEKETLTVEINIPDHADRVTTSLFTRTRKALIEREGGKCWICQRTEAEAGPLEAHHVWVERSLAEMIDWKLFAADCQRGILGPFAKQFDWDSFLSADPFDPYTFVDNMLANGLLVCKDHHTHADMGIHTLPLPLWIAQRWGKDGYQFSDVEIIHHQEH